MTHQQNFENNLKEILDFGSDVSDTTRHANPEHKADDSIDDPIPKPPTTSRPSAELIIRIIAGLIVLLLLIAFGTQIAFR